MSVIRRFVRWALVIAVVGACALLAATVSGRGVGSVEQPPALIPGPNTGLPGITQVAATAGQGYADYLETMRRPEEIGNQFKQDDGRNKTAGIRLRGRAQRGGVTGARGEQVLKPDLVLGKVSGTCGVIDSQRPAAGAEVPRGSAVNIYLKTALVPVPNLVSRTVDEARGVPASAGLVLRNDPAGDRRMRSHKPAAKKKGAHTDVRAVVGADPGIDVEVMQSRTDRSPPTFVVRIEPRADSGTQVLEEVHQ